jgi:hypothetical protein
VLSAWSSSFHRFLSSCRRSDRIRRGRTGDAIHSSAPSSAAVVPRWLLATVAAGTALGSLVLIGVTLAPAVASAATAPAATQCNPPAFPTGAGEQTSCNIAITNTVTSAGATSSTITATACLAAAGVLPPAGCTTTVTTSNQLVSSINQCNGIVTGGGSNVVCNVSFTNDVTSGTSTSGATVNECNGSGTGGGTQPTVVCAPVASTTGATVTQCNGSGTGGGAAARVECSVTGGSTALPVTINQCNGSGNGGGSTVTCTTTITNNFLASTTVTTPTSPSGTSPAPSSGSGGTGTAAAGGVGSGLTGLTGSAPGAGGSTGTSPVGALGVVPSGGPQTGLGGASHSRDSNLLFAAALLFLGAGLALTIAVRRRRNFSVQGANETP